jgi:hypothetical protein
MSDPYSLVLCFRRINVLDLFEDAFNFDDIQELSVFQKHQNGILARTNFRL